MMREQNLSLAVKEASALAGEVPLPAGSERVLGLVAPLSCWVV